MFWDSGLLLWCALVMVVGALVLLVAAICSEPLDEEPHDESGQPGGHKSPPHYTLDDWT